MRSDGMDCRFEIGHLEEKHGLIAGGIGLRTFGFQTDERSVSSELGMVPGLLVREVEAQCVEVKLLGALQVFKIKLYSHKLCGKIAHKFSRPVSDRSPARQSGVSRFGKRSEEHTSELQSRLHLVCRLLLEKKK